MRFRLIFVFASLLRAFAVQTSGRQSLWATQYVIPPGETTDPHRSP